ncbi:hypothetical protein [Streptomyces sp. NPDC006335]|uniref:hypothetical protein n=1 Tax=Streptomyces sp. NPDC006335 TaxID=3156895 RepID=UPI0033AB7B5F
MTAGSFMSRNGKKTRLQGSFTDPDGILATFYTTERAGAFRLSDGGGPFGFDITTALQVDYLIRSYGCDGIVETGSFLGDTASYMAARYPHLPLRTCDVSGNYASFARARLAPHTNAAVLTGNSADLLPDMIAGMRRPFVYLDAHWYDVWPLQQELSVLEHAVVAIDDFDIGHPRFSFDAYDGVRCGPELVAEALPDQRDIYVGDPEAVYPYPCLQTGRRSGTAFLLRDLEPAALRASSMFRRIPLHPGVRMPSWTSVPAQSAVLIGQEV